MKSIKIEKEDQRLLVRYTPSINYDGITSNLNEGLSIKRTFWVNHKNLIECNEEDEYICFSIAFAEGDYYCLDKDVFNTQNTIYIEKTLDISDKWFISYPHTSIFSIIDRLLSDDLFIVEENDGEDNHLPVADFLNLIEAFPNSYEKDKYAQARIAYLLSDYIEGMWKHKESYEKYLDKKEKALSLTRQHNIKLIGYEMYKKAAEELEQMLQNPLPYSESLWQEKIYDIICVLYPKYIASFREIEVGSDERHSKRPDFLLVDTSGFIDILEIKKPNDKKTCIIHRMNRWRLKTA